MTKRTADPSWWDGLHMPRAVPAAELLEVFDDLLRIQCSNGNWNWDPYMHGMANGMILMRSLVSGEDPVFLDPPPDGFLADKPQPPHEVVRVEEKMDGPGHLLTVDEVRDAGRRALQDPENCAAFKARYPELAHTVHCGSPKEASSFEARYALGFEAGQREAKALMRRFYAFRYEAADPDAHLEEAKTLVTTLTLSGGRWANLKNPSPEALAILQETVKGSSLKVYRGIRLTPPTRASLTGPDKDTWVGMPLALYEAALELKPGTIAPAWLRKSGNDFASTSKSERVARQYLKEGHLQILLSATVSAESVLADLTNWKRVLTRYGAADPTEDWSYFSREKEVLVLEPITWTIEDVHEASPGWRK